LKKYSNFVNFPIYLNGKRVNTLSAIWADDPRQVKEEDYTAFYKFIANAPDVPLETIHFRADAPIDVKALFFIPQFHSEKYGMERMPPGVSLYSRKVLIEANSPDILPDWLRFVKGVVDSEDLPLAISREKTQDSALLGKLRKTLTRKIVSYLEKMARKDKSKYLDDFYKEYQYFLKEGICQDVDSKEQLAKLLYFETSRPTEDNPDNTDMVSLDEYVARMPPEQTDIYYLVAPSRESAVNSPYLEAFEKNGVEVIFCFNPIEDFVMANLEKHEGRNLTSAEKSDIDLSKIKKKDDFVDGDGENDEDKDENEDLYGGDRKLNAEESLDFCNWFKDALGDKKVGTCTVTNRLTSSPAIIVDSESGAMRRMMRMVDTSEGGRDSVPLGKQNVEINAKHAIITGLYDIREKEPTLAKVLAEQIYDDCLIAGGLLDDSRTMLPRINDILLCVVNGAQKSDLNDVKNETMPEKEIVDVEKVEEAPNVKTKPKTRAKSSKDEIIEASYEEKNEEGYSESDNGEDEKDAKKPKKRAARKSSKKKAEEDQ
jgi:HSP90 family molecular chaperone